MYPHDMFKGSTKRVAKNLADHKLLLKLGFKERKTMKKKTNIYK